MQGANLSKQKRWVELENCLIAKIILLRFPDVLATTKKSTSKFTLHKVSYVIFQN